MRENIQFNEYGICSEALWPYSDENVLNMPSGNCYHSAKDRGSVIGVRLLPHHTQRPNPHPDDILQLKACLCKNSPFIFGFHVYGNFEMWDGRAGSGIMPEPPLPLTHHHIGHAVMAVGYDDSIGRKGCVIVLNSWGKKWGNGGFFYMPYDIIVDPDICFDFWRVS